MTSTYPLFSIIVPAFNVAPYLRACLDSVLAQRYRDWECIVVDDESTDGGGEILDEYAAKDGRIKVIHQKNAGEGGARNAGLAAAKGEWVFFLDGDDLMLPDALEKLVGAISPEVDLIRFGYVNFDDGEAVDIPSESGEARDVDIGESIGMSEFYSYVWQHIYRRDKIGGIKFKRYIRGCDRVYIDDVLLNRVDKVRVVDTYCYGYRKRMGSAVNSVPTLQVLQDEMDHRLDIMEMIDQSKKTVEYSGDIWLEGYFTRGLYWIAKARKDDRAEVLKIWRQGLRRLLARRGLSGYGRFMAWTCSRLSCKAWDDLLCYVIPRLREGGSPLRALKRRLFHV